MTRPSLEVAPVRKTSVTSAGISLRITAAVRVLPWTTLTLRSGLFFTYSVPPPLSDSFCQSSKHPRQHGSSGERNRKQRRTHLVQRGQAEHLHAHLVGPLDGQLDLLVYPVLGEREEVLRTTNGLSNNHSITIYL